MPLTVQGKRQIAQAVEAAKKRKVNQKRTAFQQALNQPKKVENPVRRVKRLGQIQQPTQTSLTPKQQQAMEMFNQVQANKRRRLGQPQQQVTLPQQNVPLPKTQRTMSNEEMQRRMKERRKREQSQQTPEPPQQPQQQLPPRVQSILRRPRRRIQRRPVTVNPDA